MLDGSSDDDKTIIMSRDKNKGRREDRCEDSSVS